ncbi:MAG: zf-HC2 domain-containing protein [Pyrinomonadaceae bacterium]
MAEHLASCGTCRQQFERTNAARKVDASLSFTLAPESLLRHDHLQYEQLAHCLDGDLDAEEREILDLHLRACENCREDVQSLREFRRQIAPEMSVSYAPAERVPARKVFRPVVGWTGWWRPAYAAAAVLVLVIALVTAISIRERRVGERPAQVPQVAGGVDAPGLQKDSVSTPPTEANDNANRLGAVAQAGDSSGNIPAPPVKSPGVNDNKTQAQSRVERATGGPVDSTTTIAELKDGDLQITVDGAGKVTGLDRLNPADAQVVKETLLAQNIPRPAELAELAGEHGALRGGSASSQSFRLLSPSRIVTSDDRPSFKWEALPEATGYRVYVGDSRNREAASSGDLPPSSTEWTPSAPLPRGGVYTWVVIAKVNGVDVIAPAASQPEVKFKVLSAEAMRELTELRNSRRSHLALGIFYARAGMIEEAERELTALVQQNPKSQVAVKLLRSVQSWR